MDTGAAGLFRQDCEMVMIYVDIVNKKITQFSLTRSVCYFLVIPIHAMTDMPVAGLLLQSMVWIDQC